MSHFVNQRLKYLGRTFDQLQLKNKEFTLFSNDCWGAEVYKYFNLPFTTPFIGLMLSAPCYLRLLKQPKHYFSQPLVFQEKSHYDAVNALRAGWKHWFPIATLGNSTNAEDLVEIQFLHYHAEAEATDKWARRVERINWDNLFIKFDGSKDYATPELVREFDALPYPKLTLLKEPLEGVKSAVVVPNYTTDGLMQFERSLPYYNLVSWLNNNSKELTLPRKAYNRVFFNGMYS